MSDRIPDNRPVFGAVIRATHGLIQVGHDDNAPEDRWLRPAPAGVACDACNLDNDVITLTLDNGRIVVNLCCACLEEAASYAQP